MVANELNIMGLHEVVGAYNCHEILRVMNRAKYFKVLDSVESDPVQPLDVLSEQGTCWRKYSPWKKLLFVTALIFFIVAIVFIALYAREISTKKNTGTTKNSKCEAPRTETNTTTHPVCLSHDCVFAAAG